MQDKFYYPILCTDLFAKTVAFYEDYFDFIPEKNMDNFVLLYQKSNPDIKIAVIGSDCPALPLEARTRTSGLIINFPVDNVDTMYHQCYWEGLDLHGEPVNSPCGRRHFMVRDPNGIFLDIMQRQDKIQNSGIPYRELMDA